MVVPLVFLTILNLFLGQNGGWFLLRSFESLFQPALNGNGDFQGPVFFLRLPFDHHGPVSELSQSNLYTLCCTGPFNWGEAHCAGEKVKQTNRTISKEVS